MTTSNYVLILMGLGLIAGGAVIVYRTVAGMIRIRKTNPSGKLHWESNLINVIIGVAFFLAGILFVVNNLKGNPLALPWANY